jgi:hypothetical protein
VNIKLMGDNDSIVILMPPLYVEGFLRKVDASAQ